ncbi:28482_t:CDS:2, partial [Dentiscutata erythropus]
RRLSLSEKSSFKSKTNKHRDKNYVESFVKEFNQIPNNLINGWLEEKSCIVHEYQKNVLKLKHPLINDQNMEMMLSRAAFHVPLEYRLRDNLNTIFSYIKSHYHSLKQLEFTQSIASRVITELHVERGQLKDRIRVLERENEQLRQDLEYERHLNESRIANMNIQINNSQNREDILREALNNIEDVRTIPPLRRQGAFLFEDEVLDSD